MPSASRKLPEAERAIIAAAPVVDLDPLGGGDPVEHLGDLLDRGALEVEALAAVGDRRHHLVGLGRGEDEDGVRRRLLERLEEGVPGLFGQHVRLVEDVDLPAAAGRRVGDPLAQVADVVDRAVRGGVHLDHVDRGAGGDRQAGLAFAAGGDGRAAALAVERAGEDLRHRGLAGPARADEEVGVVDLVLLDRVAQGADDVLLADHLVEGSGPVAAVEGGRVAGRGHCGQCIHGPTRSPGTSPVRCAGADRGPQLADARRLGRRRRGAAAGVFPPGSPTTTRSTRCSGAGNWRTGSSPDYGAALPPTPHPLDRPARPGPTPLGDGAIDVTMVDRLRLPRPDRLPRLPARLALVRPLDRRRRRGDRPDPRALPLQRAARLHRPPLHRPLPRRAADRDQAPPSRLAGPRPARPRRPAAPRGLALRRRLLALPRLRPGRWADSQGGNRPVGGVAADGGSGRPRARLAGCARRWPGRCSGRSSTGSPPAARPTRSPAPAKRSKPSSARPARSTSSSTGRARLGEVLQWPGMVGAFGGVVLGFAFLRRRSALGIAAARPRPRSPSPCSPPPAWRSSPATRCSAAAILAIFVALALLGWRLLERGHPWRRAWQAFAGAGRADVRGLGCRTSTTSLHTVDTDLTNQARIEA